MCGKLTEMLFSIKPVWYSAGSCPEPFFRSLLIKNSKQDNSWVYAIGITDLEAIWDIINVIIPMTVVCAGIFAVAYLASYRIRNGRSCACICATAAIFICNITAPLGVTFAFRVLCSEGIIQYVVTQLLCCFYILSVSCRLRENTHLQPAYRTVLLRKPSS